jgi:tubulin alpha
MPLVNILLLLLIKLTHSLTEIATSRNVVVTGANRGLGLEFCKQLVEKPTCQRVYAICRKMSPELAELAQRNNKLEIVDCIDIMKHADAALILKKHFKTNTPTPIQIHLLLHNAGAYGPPEGYDSIHDRNQSQHIQNITPDRFRYAFELNAAAPLFLTQALLPNLRAAVPDAKVALISSAMGSISDNSSGGHYAYRASKAAVNMVGKGLSVDLLSDRVAVGMIHPGYVYTGFGGTKERVTGQRDADVSAKGVFEAIDAISLSNTGCFLHGNYGEGVFPLNW